MAAGARWSSRCTTIVGSRQRLQTSLSPLQTAWTRVLGNEGGVSRCLEEITPDSRRDGFTRAISDLPLVLPLGPGAVAGVGVGSQLISFVYFLYGGKGGVSVDKAASVGAGVGVSRRAACWSAH